MTATPLLKRIDIFISSPGDVDAERETIKWAAEYLNRLIFIREGYLLRPLEYLELVPPEMGLPAQVIVDRYLNEPDQCYLLICVLWRRMGTPFTHPVTNQTYQSGTEYEFTKAYDAHKQNGRPLVLLYRRDPADEDDSEQHQKVKAFFERVTAADADLVGLYRRYASLEEFNQLVVQHIAHVLNTNPPQDTPATVQRPPMIEEERRLDTAIPQTARVGQPTELWAQLCVAESPGFRDQLPEERTSEFELSRRDIGSQSLGVVFPTNADGRAEPTVLYVEVVAPDFQIASPRMALKVDHGKDSARLLFSLVPTAERAKSIVHVHVKQRMPEGVEVLVAAAALYVKTVSEEVVSPIWSLFRSPLRAVRTLLSQESGLRLSAAGMPSGADGEAYREMMAAQIPDEVRQLVERLSWDWNNRHYTVQKLQKFGPLATAACLQALHKKSHAWQIIEILQRLETPIKPLLLAALSDESARMRGNAAQALGRIGDALAGPSLLRVLKDPDSGVKSAAASALGNLGRRGDIDALEPLIVALGDRAVEVRSAAASALGHLGPAGVPRSFESLIAALQDPDGRVRSAAARALGHLGPAGMPRSFESLIAALQDHDGDVRSAAAAALGELKDTAAIAPLVECLFKPDMKVRNEASNALHSLGDPAVRAILAAGPKAIQALVEIATADMIIWSSNSSLLKAIGEPAVAPLVAALRRCQSRSDWGYNRITGVLKSIGTPAALAALPPDVK